MNDSIKRELGLRRAIGINIFSAAFVKKVNKL